MNEHQNVKKEYKRLSVSRDTFCDLNPPQTVSRLNNLTESPHPIESHYLIM